ncbi:PREDICTED: DNA repair protein RAD4 isoform X2 [Nicotiana attenuata]|uniref:Dna repair protein rad4 n=1 Tax=Nicotiana attenuata TaxID=49451 RepID=A0A314KLL4_NICAT|nr:PREDICTED: DNA repair protein RAD4 isoform X2 [Nicotiana attenuata]OIT30226.1 dna repair protein rad4 [Nicotiana attenuata]
MRTRNQAKLQNQSTANEESVKHCAEMESRSGCKDRASDNETLANISRGAVGKLLKRVNKSRGSRGVNTDDSYLCKKDSTGKPETGSKKTETQLTGTTVARTTLDAECCTRDVLQNVPSEVENEGTDVQYQSIEREDELDGIDWEDGSVHTLKSESNINEDTINGVTVEFDALPDSSKQKTVRRATAEEKELAEVVHKVNLLCLLARGRLVDSACNDPLIQASLLSLLPAHLLKLTDVPKLTAKALTPLVSWFHSHFCVRGASDTEKSFHSALASTLESQEGTSEEVAALSVALFRALDLTTRFVSILDVASLKPEIEKPYPSGQSPSKAGSGIFNSSTLMVAAPKYSPLSPAKSLADGKHNNGKARATITDKSDKRMSPSTSDAQRDANDECIMKRERPKRKGDLEFEMQLEMALSSTAVEIVRNTMVSELADVQSTSSNVSPFKKKKIKAEECSTSSHGISTAVGSRKVGAPLYWAEVYCSGENLTGKWVHVDVVNAITDGEQNVEAAAAACKLHLRYVVAFAGNGAKDVTRRYCTKWYKIASERVNSIWWDAVLAPLKELESVATSDVVHLRQETSDESKKTEVAQSTATRSSLEDMELETRALTEPLPTNQQAYRNHRLYIIERWLNKYQILYPKGPVLGFCSGHPVYPRSCVQTLKRKEKWFREGLQVKANEIPAKVLKHSGKQNKEQDVKDHDYGEEDCGGTVALYGQWQTEPLFLPPAVNGIVPKNERGQVDVWSEKCLPPGTVHLRLPRLVPVAKRLEIDFAPAMVGFEFRNGRALPVYEGIVVCTEFKDAILETYAEEEERRQAKERKRSEAEALSRWYQLLASLITRQRLHNCYVDGASSQSAINFATSNDKSCLLARSTEDKKKTPEYHQEKSEIAQSNSPPTVLAEDHVHVFLVEDQTVDEESSTRTKRCRCGFSVQYEEL